MKTIYFAHDQQESPAPRAQMLEMAGFEVRLFSNGDELHLALGQSLPSLVILDVLLDGKTGFDICRRIRSDYDAATLPILLTSDIYRGHAFREEAHRAGAQRYLLRPIDPADLLAAVNELVAGQGERAA